MSGIELPASPPQDGRRLLALLNGHGKAVLRVKGTGQRPVAHTVAALMLCPYPDIVSTADTAQATAMVTAMACWVDRHRDALLDAVRLRLADRPLMALDIAARLWLVAPPNLPPQWGRDLIDAVGSCCGPPGVLAEQYELAMRWHCAAAQPDIARRCHQRGHDLLRAAATAVDADDDRARIVPQLWRGIRWSHRLRQPRWTGHVLGLLAQELTTRPDPHQDALRRIATGELLSQVGRHDPAAAAFSHAIAVLTNHDIDDPPASVHAHIGLARALVGLGLGPGRARAALLTAQALVHAELGDRAGLAPDSAAVAVGDLGENPWYARSQYLHRLLTTPARDRLRWRDDLTLLGTSHDTGVPTAACAPTGRP